MASEDKHAEDDAWDDDVSESKSPQAESKEADDDPADVKVILLGDSAVGKSKLVERYLMDEYVPRQLSTYALTLYRKDATLEDGRSVKVDFWDTAGQERFKSLHPSYYHLAKCCILVFDVTRKATYSNLSEWYKELREQCESIPCILVANKIDIDPRVTGKEFKFARRHGLSFFFVSAADGTNVVQLFNAAIANAVKYKETPGNDFLEDVMDFLNEPSPLDNPAGLAAGDAAAGGGGGGGAAAAATAVAAVTTAEEKGGEGR